MKTWLVILAAGALTYLLRASLILLFSRAEVPRLLERAFRYVAPAVLAALAVPAFVAPAGAVALDPPRLAGLAAGGLVAWRFHSVLGTLAAGMGSYLLVSAL
jgi:branched-subunit amino acid transport protein